MPRFRSAYPPEFRRQMVELVRSGRTPEDLSREFEPTAQFIANWVRQAERDAGKRSDGPTSAEREELIRLRRENHRLRQERDILSKAAAWFARESKANPNGFSGFLCLSVFRFPTFAASNKLPKRFFRFFGCWRNRFFGFSVNWVIWRLAN